MTKANIVLKSYHFISSYNYKSFGNNREMLKMLFHIVIQLVKANQTLFNYRIQGVHNSLSNNIREKKGKLKNKIVCLALKQNTMQ